MDGPFSINLFTVYNFFCSFFFKVWLYFCQQKANYLEFNNLLTIFLSPMLSFANQTQEKCIPQTSLQTIFIRVSLNIYIYIYFFFLSLCVLCCGYQNVWFHFFGLWLFFWHKCTFSPYILPFFHFSPYILILSLLVPKSINVFHFGHFRQPTNRNC